MKKILLAALLTFPSVALAQSGIVWGASTGTVVGVLQGGELISDSTITATNFIGNGYNITGMTIGASSSAVNGGSFDIASLTDVSIATATTNLRGGRVGAVVYTIDVLNNSAGQRDYTLSFIEDGVTHDSHIMTLPSNDGGQIGDMHLLTPTPSGGHNYTIVIRTSNASGTQTANHAVISVIEW